MTELSHLKNLGFSAVTAQPKFRRRTVLFFASCVTIFRKTKLSQFPVADALDLQRLPSRDLLRHRLQQQVLYFHRYKADISPAISTGHIMC
jgi:hypothetical protein